METNSMNCSSRLMPSISDYFKAKKPFVYVSSSVGAVVLVIVIIISVNSIKYGLKNLPSKTKTYTIYLLAIYPVVSLLNYLVILVPRCYILSEAITQGMLAGGLYQLFCLFICYSGGEDELVRKTNGSNLNLRVPPLCCFPCCKLPSPDINKRNIKRIKYMVVQLPIVLGLYYFIMLVLWIENKDLYELVNTYTAIIAGISTLIGMWGLIILTNYLSSQLDKEFRFKPKFISLQFVHLISQVQSSILKSLYQNDVLPCNLPITPKVYAYLIHNEIMMVEVLLLALLARRFYKRPLPGWNHQIQRGISTIFGADENGIENQGYKK